MARGVARAPPGTTPSARVDGELLAATVQGVEQFPCAMYSAVTTSMKVE
jgi:hypothetical protein